MTWLWLVACNGDPKPTDTAPADGDADTDADTDADADTDTDADADTAQTSGDTGGCAAGFGDADGDGYGDPAVPTTTCDDPAAVADATDCDDTRAAVHPGADEACDGLDTDCDAATAEDGLVTEVSAGGAVVDLTAEFAAGAPDAPVVVDLEDGRYDLCAGTFFVHLRAAGVDATIDGHGVATVDGGRSATVLAVDGGVVTVVGVTVTGGEGSVPASNGAGLTGGGFACVGDADVTFDAVTFVDNHAEIGGAWFVDACTVHATATTLTANHATYGGGLYAFDGTIDLTGAVVTANTAVNSGGGLGLEGTGPRPALTLTDTVVSDNTAQFGGGLVTYENAEATCVGAVGATAGFVRNTATGQGGAVYVTGADFPPRFTADTCDFGVGADDNVPSDVVTAYASTDPHTFGDDATFSCDPTGCF
ncbi:MAG: putative metal-binding motif-containing protein [Myxococcota bacterium]